MLYDRKSFSFILFPLRILVVPIIAGISYELLKLSAKFKDNAIVHMIVSPGIWLQKITTKEPDEGQLEVALVALRCALGGEYSPAETAHPHQALVS